MEFKCTEKQVSTITQTEARMPNLPVVRDNIHFVREKQTRLFCYRACDRAVVLLFTPKSPMREVSCAMRIVPETSSVTCLLSDAQFVDLARVVGLLRSSPPSLAWKSPLTSLAFLNMLTKECGLTSELKRQDLDKVTLNAEVQPNSTLWSDPKIELEKPPGKWSNNPMLGLKRCTLPWLRAASGEGDWVALLDDLQFELTHTVNRKAQIECLKDRISVQINLIDNMIAHQENSQANLIAILALFLAPASLIAISVPPNAGREPNFRERCIIGNAFGHSIFSAGIFATNNSSWIAFLATMVPVTLITVISGLSFIGKHKMMQAWRNLWGLSRRRGELSR
ncbi:hypothetical protein VM1G_08833 [Cytospora mali]|uniref:Uncharacterized protein n=1 Tax=Cytospora mali TaxID=578113 RepID=A0A194WAQ9_CYTMA|nr:hypothetical protein VM1G_08833 [Valsa mali]